MRIREIIDERHEAIRSRVVRMHEIALDMTKDAVEAIVLGDVDIANGVIGADDEMDELESAVLADTMRAVGLEAPVAHDLRFLVATLSIASELERAADHAVKLARRGRKICISFPGELKRDLSELGEETRTMLSASVRLYLDFDAAFCEEVIKSDKKVDKHFSRVRNQVLQKIVDRPEDTELLMRTINAFQALEHIADQAVLIAKKMHQAYAPDMGREESSAI